MVIYSIPPLTKELFLRGKKKKKVVLTVMQWVNDPSCLCGIAGSIPGLEQWVKDPVGHRCSLDSSPGVGTSICCGCGQKQGFKNDLLQSMQ